MKKILVYAGAVLGLLILAYSYLPQILSGKIVNQNDITGWHGMANESVEWNEQHPDDKTYWTESMFGGMPNTTFYTPTDGDWTQPLYNLFLTGKRPSSYFFLVLLGAFLMLLAMGISPIVAFFGAIAVGFCSYNMQIILVGHNTKMQAIAFFPWVMAALIFSYRSIFREKRWFAMSALGAALFGLTVSFQVKANHPQITYYLAMVILIYALVLLVWVLMRRKDVIKRFFIVSSMLLVLGCCGIGTNAIKLMPTMEYTPYSMRGGSSEKSDDGSKDRKGLKLDYATAWSYAWEELPNLVIPNYNGGSSSGAVTKDSETYKILKQAGQPNVSDICSALPLYWGPQPFTAGPNYMGVVTVFLFILGLLYYRGRREKVWIAGATLLAILLSLGYHFMWFTELFFKFAPLYNKFRTVSMSLIILQVTMPALGFLMLDDIVRNGKDVLTRKNALVAGGFTVAVLLLFALLQSMTGSFVSPSDSAYPEALIKSLAADRHQLLWADTWRSVILIAASTLILAWGLGGKDNSSTGKRAVSAILVGVLLVLDLFLADKRYLSEKDLITPRNFESQFDKRPVDEMILSDPDPNYRVLDLTSDMFNDAFVSYWHKNIGGYSPAKLQRYQEFIERSLISEITQVMDSVKNASTVQEAEGILPYCPGLASMNCKYFIISGNNPPVRYRYARGNAWFENGEGRVALSSYAPNRLKYICESETGGKLVFSEVYYPKGWKLRMDGGSELPISLYDGDALTPSGILRCADVPSGLHELEMSFEPDCYARGEAISRACSIAIFLVVLLALSFALVGCRRK